MLKPEIEDRIYNYIKEYESAHGFCPTVREMVNAGLGVKSYQTMSDYLNDLIGDGKLIRPQIRSRVLLPGKTKMSSKDVEYGMEYRKVYVGLNVDYSPEGIITPRSYTWEDGRKFYINAVLGTKSRPDMSPGYIVYRYTIQVGSNERYIFMEIPADPKNTVTRWFMEAPVID